MQGRASSGRAVESTAQFRASTANPNPNASSAFACRGPAAGANALRPRALLAPTGPLPRGGAQGVLLDLARQLRANKGRLVDFFRDGDRSGVGACSAFKFRSALGRAGLAVDDAMFAELAAAFARPAAAGPGSARAELLNWRAFVEQLNDAKQSVGDGSAFGAGSSGQTSAPASSGSAGWPEFAYGGSRPGTGDGGGFAARSITRGALESGGAEAETEDLLDAIGDIVATRRLLVKPFFQDLDKCTSNQVTEAQMGSVMSQNVGLDLTARERSLLFAAFQVVDGKGAPTGRFNYKQFVKRVDPVEVC